VKLPSVPGPSDVLAAVDGVREGVAEALELLPRLGRIVGRLEELLDRVDGLVDRVGTVVDRAETAMDGLDRTRERADAAVGRAEATIDRADGAIDRADGAIDRAEGTVGRAESTVGRAEAAIEAVGGTQRHADAAIAAVAETREKADEAITAVGRTTEHADAVLGRAEGLVTRVEPLARDYAEPMALLAPAVQRLAETLEPDEVEALVRMIDQLPSLATHLDEVVLPVLGSMDNVGQDVHDLVDTMQDLRQVVKGFPGSRLFRRRGAEEIAQDEESETEDGQVAAGS
jgi:ABC-type transporter Mla subunit MlaD